MTFSWRRILIFLVVLLVIGGVILVVVTPGTSRNQLVGLGDSYASGEGLSPFVSTSDTTTNHCHQSASDAYALVAAKDLSLKGVNQACSGATTATMMNGNGAGEPGQIINLDHAKDITVTIGGNDINALGAVLNPPTAAQLTTELQQLQPKLVSTYRDVQQTAPLAHIAVTGYPDIVPTTPAAGCFISQPEATELVSALNSLDATIKAAAIEAKVDYVDFSNVFVGHEVCTAQPFVNGIDLANISASLHPTAAGQTAMGNSVAAALQTK